MLRARVGGRRTVPRAAARPYRLPPHDGSTCGILKFRVGTTIFALTWVANLAVPGSSRSRTGPRGESRSGHRALEQTVREEKSHGHSSAASLGLGNDHQRAAPVRPSPAVRVLG